MTYDADETRLKVEHAVADAMEPFCDCGLCTQPHIIADAAIAAYEAAQWRTIDSAPKDGTAVMVWGSWCSLPTPADRIIIASYDDSDDEGGDWYEVTEGCPFWPTHWRPLPPPPA
jgi:hypothetical protein